MMKKNEAANSFINQVLLYQVSFTKFFSLTFIMLFTIWSLDIELKYNKTLKSSVIISAMLSNNLEF